MNVYIIHPDNQTVPAHLAQEVLKSLPDSAKLQSASEADPEEADLVVAIFNLKHGAFAPIIPCYLNLRDKQVAFVATLTGQIDDSRLNKTVWGIKKSFCGNKVVGGFMCRVLEGENNHLEPHDIDKAKAFAKKIFEACSKKPNIEALWNERH